MGIASIILDSLDSVLNIGTSIYDRIDAKKQDAKDKAFAAEQAQINRDFQRDERLATQDFNVNMWNMNNEYNSLSSQLERAKAAGVNPGAILGGGYSPAQSNPVSSSPMPGSQAPAVGGLGQALLSHGLNTTANIGKLAGNLLNNEKTDVEIKFDKLSMPARIEHLNTEISKNKAFTALTDAQQAGVLETNKWISRKESAQLDTIFAQLDETRSKISLLDAQTETEKERKELVDAQTYSEISLDGLREEQMAGQQTQNEISLEELKQSKLRNAFSEITNIPYGTAEFEFAYWLWQHDEFENYCGMLMAESVSTDGGKWVADILSHILSMFGKGKKAGKRTTTHTYSPKGTTISESTTIPI